MNDAGTGAGRRFFILVLILAGWAVADRPASEKNAAPAAG